MRFEYPRRFRLEIDRFRLEAGEKIGVVGPNGSGKTTLLRILALLERPSSWERFRYRDGEVTPGRTWRGSIGFLRQQPWLFQGTVFDNLAYGLKVRGRPAREIREKVLEISERLELTPHANAPARKLSGGEQKRVALGRVLITEPEILLLDEPMAHLDKGSQVAIENVLAESPATVVLTTHDPRLAWKLADRVVSLKDGRLSGDQLPVNIFQGLSEGNRMTTRGGLVIQLPRTISGSTARCAVNPTAIAISLEPVASSIRNAFPGRIRSIHGHAESVWLEIEGKETFTAVISRASYEEMLLNLDREVVVLFKASSVELL